MVGVASTPCRDDYTTTRIKRLFKVRSRGPEENKARARAAIAIGEAKLAQFQGGVSLWPEAVRVGKPIRLVHDIF